MNCPKCNAEILKSNAKFCPKCGYNLSSAEIYSVDNKSTENTQQAMNVHNAEGASFATMPKITIKMTRTVKLVLILIPILIGAFYIYKYITAPPTPDKIVSNFLNQLKSGNYDKAYAFFDDTKLIGNEYLSLESFKKSFEKNPVKDFRYTVNTNSQSSQTSGKKTDKYNGGKMDFDVTLVFENGSNHLKLSTVNLSPDGRKYNIKINPAPFIGTVNFNIHNAVLDKVSIDNKPYDLKKNNKSLSMFNGLGSHLSINTADVKPIEIDFKAGDNIVIDKSDLKPSDEVISTIKKSLEDYNKIWNDSLYNNKIDDFKPYVLENSDEWQKLVDYLGAEWLAGDKLLNIEFGKIYFEGTGMSDDANDYLSHVAVETDESWFDADSSTSDTIKWRYHLQKCTDGKWRIYYVERRY